VSNPHLLALGAVFGLCAVAPAQTFTRIADTSTPIPNGTGAFTSFLVVTPSVSGSTVAFYGAGSGNQRGIYSSPIGGGTLTVVADVTTAIPNGTATLVVFLHRARPARR
jgi:hypothetical protein